MTGHSEDGGKRRRGSWRPAVWGAAGFLLLLPLVAMQFTDAVDWTAGDFAFAAVLLFGSLGVYELAARISSSKAYRAGAGLAILASFLLIWSNAAVGITDSDADLMFFLCVPTVAIVGAAVARFRPLGMARAMLATALTLAVIAVVALISGIIPEHNSGFEILGITWFFTILFVGSALLFREAGRGDLEPGAL
jgi:hypothetical protein